MYYGVDEDATEMPWSYNYSSWDGSHNIYFKDGVEACSTWTKVGIQSIYYGSGVCNKSSVVWAETPAGISDMTMDNKPSKTLIFNVAGQRLAAPQKGLNIINGRKVLIK